MTKKDYETIAGVFRSRRERLENEPDPILIRESQKITVWQLERDLADIMANDNPRFDRSRFLAACRGEDSKDSAGRKVTYASR